MEKERYSYLLVGIASYGKEIHESAAVTRPEHARSYPLRRPVRTQAGRRTLNTMRPGSIGDFSDMLGSFAPLALLFWSLYKQPPVNGGNERGGSAKSRSA